MSPGGLMCCSTGTIFPSFLLKFKILLKKWRFKYECMELPGPSVEKALPINATVVPVRVPGASLVLCAHLWLPHEQPLPSQH